MKIRALTDTESLLVMILASMAFLIGLLMKFYLKIGDFFVIFLFLAIYVIIGFKVIRKAVQNLFKRKFH